MDLRGYGASDKPPRGYDTITSAADVAGVVRSLGATDAVVAGQGWGGWIAWSMPALQPRVTRGVAVLAAGHPLRLRATGLAPSGLASLGTLAGFQVPFRPERSLQADGTVERMLRDWSGPGGYPGTEESERYTAAMRIPFVAHSALEYYRWAVRSVPRPDGRRFAALVRRQLPVPVLQVHGDRDPVLPARRVRGSSAFAGADYRWEQLPGVGHFPAEEAPERVSALLTDWLAGLPR